MIDSFYNIFSCLKYVQTYENGGAATFIWEKHLQKQYWQAMQKNRQQITLVSARGVWSGKFLSLLMKNCNRFSFGPLRWLPSYTWNLYTALEKYNWFVFATLLIGQ